MSLKARIERIEASANAGERVYGVTYVNPDGRKDVEPGMVYLLKRAEQMTVAEFEQRYPGGVLIRVTYGEDWRHEHQNTD